MVYTPILFRKRGLTGIPCPVQLHGVAGLMADPHGGLRHPGLFPVLLAELRVHVRNAARGTNLVAVFAPQQRQRHTLPGQLTVDFRKVRNGVRGSICVLPGEQDLLQVAVGDVLIQRPGDPFLSRSVLRVLDGVMRAVHRQGDLLPALPKAVIPQDFAVVDHSTPSYEDGHAFACCLHYRGWAHVP